MSSIVRRETKEEVIDVKEVTSSKTDIKTLFLICEIIKITCHEGCFLMRSLLEEREGHLQKTSLS